jgi:hypothetical protein
MVPAQQALDVRVLAYFLVPIHNFWLNQQDLGMLLLTYGATPAPCYLSDCRLWLAKI